jgi:hypothetical protein
MPERRLLAAKPPRELPEQHVRNACQIITIRNACQIITMREGLLWSDAII